MRGGRLRLTEFRDQALQSPIRYTRTAWYA